MKAYEDQVMVNLSFLFCQKLINKSKPFFKKDIQPSLLNDYNSLILMNYFLANKKYQNVVQVFKDYAQYKKNLQERESDSGVKSELPFGNVKLVSEALLLMVTIPVKIKTVCFLNYSSFIIEYQRSF